MVNITLYRGDCLEYMKGMAANSVDAVITDPPYPDYYADEYRYADGMLDFLKGFDCRQFIFWSAKVDFPLDYSAVHIWDKKTGAASMYERIFERNGGRAYRVFRHYLINSTVAASFTGDEYTGHKSQKPLALMEELIKRYTREGDTVADFFMGSGTTGVACAKTGRNFIGCEINESYFKIAEKRIAEAQAQYETQKEKP